MYYVTMQITFPIPEFARKERHLHCDIVHVTTKWVSRLVLDHAIAAIQNESRDPFGGNVYNVTMQITFPTRKFRNGERNFHCDVVHMTTKWVSSLTPDCNGVFAIKAYRVLTNQRDRSYVYAVVSLAAGGPFVGGPIVTYIFSRVSVGSACVRVWKRDCDVTSMLNIA